MSFVLFLDSNCIYAMYIVNHALVIKSLPLNFEHNTIMYNYMYRLCSYKLFSYLI